MLPLRFIQEAIFDIEEIITWYEEQREGLSFDFELCLEAGIEEVQRNPKAFQKRYKQVKYYSSNGFLMASTILLCRMK